MSTTPPDDPYGKPGDNPGDNQGGTPPSGPDYGTPSSASGYGQPAGGYGTPPPPPGGYGTPPPAGGYGAPGAPAWNLGEAISYGWRKFTENVGQILLTALVFLIATAVAAGIGAVIVNALTHGASLDMQSGRIENGTGFVGRMLAQSLASLIISIVLMTLGAVIVRGSLDVTEGRRFELGAAFSRIDFGNVILASVLVSVATTIGTFLCYLPGIVIGFLTSYTLYFVVDRNLGAVEAIKASFELTTKNLGNTILWYIVGGLIALVGFCLCGVGALVSVPVVVLGTAFTYKKLTGQPVAP